LTGGGQKKEKSGNGTEAPAPAAFWKSSLGGDGETSTKLGQGQAALEDGGGRLS